MDQAPSLELRGIAKAFGPRLLFRHVDLRIDAGEVCLLTGPNGAGKSTLMRIMAGLTRPDAGRVLCEIDPARRGYLAHATLLYPGLTARENLLFWGRASGLPDPSRAATEALNAVGLARHAHDRAGIFSRGMVQRLALARLIQAAPDLLLLDEPGTGLDTAARSLLADVVADARARGAAVAWISHDAEQDARHADRLLRLEGRSLLADGTDRGAPAEGGSC